MHTSISVRLQELEQAVRKKARGKEILDGPPDAGIQSLMRDEFQEYAAAISYDFMALLHRADQLAEEGNCDVIKIRRRIEEHLRKYADRKTLLWVALLLGVPTA